MAHAYTPGLTVTPSATIRRVRRLPLRGEVVVATGDAVQADQVVARTHRPGAVQMVNLATGLGVTPGEVLDTLAVKTGTDVHTDQVLATRQRWFGWLRSEVRCPMDGTLESVSATTGQAVVRAAPIPVEVQAYVTGRVVAIEPGHSVEVETRGAFVQGIFGLGGENRGVLVCREGVKALDAADVGQDLGGAVLVIEGSPTAAGLRGAAAAGVHAVVCGSIDGQEVRDLLGHELGVAVTGDEDLGLTLVLTEGFGALPMARRTFELLAQFQGLAASVSGATQIRAGVQRPEVVIPHDREVQGGPPDGGGDMSIGGRVRIIRAPHFGVTAEVVELPVAPEPIPTGAVVRVARVRLDSGDTLTVPRANLERT